MKELVRSPWLTDLMPCFQEEIKRDPRVTWLIEFYAAWSPQCVNFSSGFAELSAK